MLVDFQEEFSKALFNTDIVAPDATRAPDRTKAGKRFDIYRNNVIVSLVNALRDGFPLCEKLVGSVFFSELARAFVQQELPSSPLLSFYGCELPTFISNTKATDSVPYMADIASIEYARRMSYFAADADYIDPKTYQEFNELELLDIIPLLHPSVYMLSSSFPIYDIWKRLNSIGTGEIGSKAQDIIIFRHQSKIIVKNVPRGTSEFLKNIQKGDNIACAAIKLFNYQPDINKVHIVSVLFTLTTKKNISNI